MTQTRYGKGKHPLDVYVSRGGNDPAMLAYLGTFRVSNCAGCGGVQYTPRGEPVMCPKCTGRMGTVDQSSVPMHRFGPQGDGV